MDHLQTPLLDQLILHSENQPVSFHVPGHKYGTVFPERGREYFQPLLKLDATELPGLDDLHSPEGVILESEQLLADLYGTKRSFFLVNGSTSGNLAMILAAVNEDDQVLVQRNSHKSIMNGLRLARAQPIFLQPEYEQSSMIAAGVSLATVSEAIGAYPQAKVLVLTYPNYYGMVHNLKEIITLAHKHGILVLIDEAHGVHFIVGDIFPLSAVTLGADIVVQSAHKTLPAMTMGAFLHYNSRNVSLDKIGYFLQVLQSSSPSYPIMASLDAARSYLATYGSRDKQNLMEKIECFREEIDAIAGLSVLPLGTGDPLKMIIRSTNGLSGFELQKILESQGIFAELADPINVLLVLPLVKAGMVAPFDEAVRSIARAIIQMPCSNQTLESTLQVPMYPTRPQISIMAITYKEMDNFSEIFLPLTAAVGKICAETIIPYPPGIPLLMQGEVIQSEDIDRLGFLLKQGAKVQGGQGLSDQMIRVFK